MCVTFNLCQGDPVKQADAVMLGYPLGLAMSPEVRRNDLEAYEAVTDPNGPAMTWVRPARSLHLHLGHLADAFIQSILHLSEGETIYGCRYGCS